MLTWRKSGALEKEWGDKVTEHFVKRTYDIIELICDQPEIGTLEHREKNIRGFNVTRHNRMFYRFTDTQLIILNFFDNRQNPRKRKH